MENNDIDMSAFEAQFKATQLSEVMDNEIFERVAELRDRMADLEGLLQIHKDSMAQFELEVADIESLEQEVRKFLAKLLERKRPSEEKRRVTRIHIRDDQRKFDALKREWAKILSELAAREKLLRDRRKLEHSTRNAPWRIGVDGKKALPHQLEGAHRMVAAGRSIMGDYPGLGKTLQSIMTVNMLREQGKAAKVLVFTLKPVLHDFEREFKKWYPGQFVHVLNHTKKGVKSEILDLIQVMPECILLTNYEVWRRDKTLLDKLSNCQFDTVILDEAHILKGGMDSSTFRGIRQIVYAQNKCNKCGSLIVESNKSKGGPALRVTTCPKCEARSMKFGDFRSVKNVFPMTGTPILNKPHDLWAMLNLIDVDAFPELNRFLDDYCKKICSSCGANTSYYCSCDSGPRWRWVFNDGGPDRLLSGLGMKFTQRTRDSAGVKMPPQEIKHHYFELDEERYPRYTAFTRDLKEKARIAFADGTALTETETLAWYTRVRQAATWPDGIQIRDWRRDPDTGEYVGTGEVIWPTRPEDLPGESIIMDGGEDLAVEAVESGDRVIIASSFKPPLAEMQKRLLARGIRTARFDGDTPEKDRQEIIDDFNEKYTKKGEHKYDVICVNYKTGSTGLNLNGAQQIVILDREWNPGKETQMLDRVRRIDSTFESIVHILHCDGTATELMDAILDEKQQMLDGFEQGVERVNWVEKMKKWLED